MKLYRFLTAAAALLVFSPIFVFGAAYAPAIGGTGTTTPPVYGQLLVGNAGHTYTLTSTSSLGLPTFADLSSFSTTSADFWKAQRNFFSTTSADHWLTTKSTTDLAEETNLYWTPQRFDTRLTATTTLPNITTLANLGTVKTTLSGILKASSGVLSAAAAGTDYVAPGTTLTVAGTASQITSSAGAQDLSANRTWTLSLPAHVIFPGNFQATNSTTTNATTTSLAIMNLAQPAGAFLAVTPLGNIIATTTPTASGTPGGADTEVQFNDNGVFGGNSRFTFDKTDGGDVNIAGANENADGGDAGGTFLYGGSGGSTGAFFGAEIQVQGGSSDDNDGGDVNMYAGGVSPGDGDGGTINVQSGQAGENGNGGSIQYNGGNGGSVSGTGGPIQFTAGSAVGADSDGGYISFTSGAAIGAGTPGGIFFVSQGDLAFASDNTANSALLDTTLLSSSRSYSFPDASGTFCITTIACDGSGIASTSLAVTSPITKNVSASAITFGFTAPPSSPLSIPYASSTMHSMATASTSVLIVDNTTAALGLFGATGILGEYAGASNPCTNQVPTTISAIGALGGCTSINNAWWSGTDLSVANGGTGLSTFGGSGTLLFTSAADTLTSSANLTYASEKLAVRSATTTNLSATGSFYLPNGSAPVVASAGAMAIDTTSGQLRYHDGNATRVIPDEVEFGGVFSTSTLAYIGSFGNGNGTTTIEMRNPKRAITVTDVHCESLSGAAGFRLGNGTATSSYGRCSAAGGDLSGQSVAFAARGDVYVEFGSNTSALGYFVLTVTGTEDAD